MAIGIVQYNTQQVGGFDKNYDTTAVRGWCLNPASGFDGAATVTQATSGSGAFLTDGSFTYQIAAGAATNGQGANVQWTHFGLTAASAKPIRFDIKCALVGKVGELAIGMAAVDTTLIASDALTNKFVGFAVPGDDDAVVDYVCNNATDQTSAYTNTAGESVTLDTDIDFAMEITSDEVKFYRDHVLKARIKTNIPTGVLVPTIVCQSIGTTESKVDVKGISVSQAV